MFSQSHLDSLKSKCSLLEKAIQEEQKRPLPDTKRLKELKLKRLHIQEDIEHQ